MPATGQPAANAITARAMTTGVGPEHKRRHALARLRTLVCVIVIVVVASCSGDGHGASVSADARLEELAGGRHASQNPGSVNTYWLESSEGLVVIDAQRTPSDANSALEEMRETGVPVTDILITHAHPDHVGGLGALHAAYPDASIHASQATITAMEQDPLGLFELARADLDEYPDELTIPDRVIRDGEQLDVGGVELMTAEFGPAEAASMSVYYEALSGSLFVGDLVNHDATPALLEGHTCSWLTQLAELQDQFPTARMIYPGHGSPGDPDELIEQQRSYLLDVRRLIRPAIAPDSPQGASIAPDERTSIGAELEQRYPGYMDHRVASLPADMLLELNLNAVANELQTEPQSDLPDVCR